MEEALRRVKSMDANMGGTEILQPLKHIYTQPCYPDHPRQVQPNISQEFPVNYNGNTLQYGCTNMH